MAECTYGEANTVVAIDNFELLLAMNIGLRPVAVVFPVVARQCKVEPTAITLAHLTISLSATIRRTSSSTASLT